MRDSELFQPRYGHPAHNMGPREYYRCVEEVEGLYRQPERLRRLTAALGELPFWIAGGVIGALHGVSIGENMRRTIYEQTTTQAIMNLNPERFAEYKKMAGIPGRLPEFIEYFAKLSAINKNNLIGGRYRHKGPSFSLGYEIQAGLWDTMQPSDGRIGLDDTVRLLPRWFKEAPLNHVGKLYPRTGGRNRLSYEAVPIPLPGVESGVELIALDRKRAVADIVLPDDRKLEIAKRASALIVIEGIPDNELRSKLRDDLATLKKPDPATPLAGVIARRVGNVFEAAKQRENRDRKFMGVLPESMTYFIRERPSA